MSANSDSVAAMVSGVALTIVFLEFQLSQLIWD